ncbi:MAG: tetratricopeptide repeat protein [Dysgonamonadaceae bacterium]
MKLFRWFIPVFLLLSLSVYSQTDVSSLIRQGVRLHDKEDYKGAIGFYQQALSVNPNSMPAMYEMSLSYLELKDYAEALKYSTKVINSNFKPLQVDAYVVKSTALAAMEKYQDAITLLKEALVKCGDDYLLNYNLGLSYFKIQDSAHAIQYLGKSIDKKINDADAYYTYAYALIDQNRYLEALLALDSYLLLEPDGSNSKDVFEDMMDILQNKLTVVAGEDKPAQVPGVDMAQVAAIIQKTKTQFPGSDKQAEYQFFQEATKGLLTEFQSKQNEENDGLFWNYFVPTYSDILESHYFDVFCRYISVAAYPESLTWWKSNKTRVEEFIEWFETANGTDQMDDEQGESE